MRTMLRPLSAAALILGNAVPAAAQDIVVMRRAIAPGSFQTHHWDLGAFRSKAPACSPKAPATRTVRCVTTATGAAADPSSCRGPAPDANGTVEDYSTCTYRWEDTLYGNWAEGCSNATYRTRPAAACQRLGGATIDPVDASFCTGTRPGEREDAANYTGCTFTWKPKTSVCDGNGYRDLTHQCERSGGSTTTTVVTSASDVERCGAKPSEHVADSSCGSPNLLANGGFEDDLAPWTTTGKGKVVVASEQALKGTVASGAKAFQFITGTSLRQTVTLVSGRKYTIKFSVSASYDSLTIQVGNTDTNRQIWTGKPGSTWNQQTVTFTAGSADRVITFTSSNLAYIDEVSLKEG